jgi:hypothetical protein
VGRAKGREEDREIPTSDWEPDDDFYGADLPPREFVDLAAEDVLGISDLRPEDRERILKEARGRLARGETNKAVSDWLLRTVILTAFSPFGPGYGSTDESGNPIDPPYVVKARQYIARQSGAKRQDNRNSDFDKVIARCRQLAAEDYDPEDIAREAYIAIGGKRQRRSGVSYASFQHRLQGLPRIFGRDGKSPPGWRRFRERIIGALSSRGAPRAPPITG